jgi:ABC-type branched-subunit amino acid transport system substrate-binding protein
MFPSRVFSTISGLFLATSIGACSAVLGFDEYQVQTASVPPGMDAGPMAVAAECTTNRQCTERASASSDADGGAQVVPSLCIMPAGKCVPVLSEDCLSITGDYLNDKAVLIGSLFSIKGAQASTNLARQQSAMLAVEEINAAGGIPAGATSADGHPLVMVSCDESMNLLRAGQHLVEDLKVPAIVGPNTSQDTLDLSNKLTIAAHTLVLSPTAVASSIADLRDDGLTWQIIPTDVQRAPLMIQQITALETRLRQERSKPTIKLGVVYRDDALGQGTRVSLNALMLNAKPLADSVNLGDNVRIDPYDFRQANQQPLVDAYVRFAPDIIVLAGTAEVITNVMVPLEAAWPGPADSRPQYILIDSAKVPELLTAVMGNDDLRKRIRGTGVTPSPRSIAVNDTFMVSYGARFAGQPANIFGMGPAYDSTYAIAYGIASLRGAAITGPSIAQGLRGLTRGGSYVEVQSTKVLAAFGKLAAGESITAIGTFSTLQWTDNGAILGGTLEMWCIASPNGKPGFDQSGLTFEVAVGQSAGQYTQCAP